MFAAPSRSFRRRCAIAAGGLILAGGLATAFADVSGDLDGGFGTGGVVTTGISQHGDDAARAIAVQGDGKIVAVGRSGDRFSVARYHPDGSLDTDSDGDPGSHLGGDGTVTTSFGASTDARANGVAIQPDGKIVVVGRVAPPFDLGGEEPGDFAVARYEPDGDLDETFSTDGLVTTQFPGDPGAEANDIALQADGKIVVVGDSCADQCGSPGVTLDFTLARYNTDGTLDTNGDADPGTHLDADGMLTTDFAGRHESAHGVAIQGDGKIVVGGGQSDTDFESGGFVLARYSPSDGSLDPSFGTGGRVTSGFGSEQFLRSEIALQPGGEIVIAGEDGGGDFALARYTSGGTPDTSFDGDGQVTTDFGGNDSAASVAVSGGSIVAAGTSRSGGEFGGPAAFAVARYNGNGSLDTNSDGNPGVHFSGDGKQTTDLGPRTDDAIRGVAIDGGEPIVAGGSRGVEEHTDHVVEMPSDFVLARYESDGDLKVAFGGDGIVETQFGSLFGDRANASAAQDDRKIVAVGSTVDEQGAQDDEDVVVARYHPDGTLDTNADTDPGVHFGGGDGVLTTDLSGADLNDTANAVAIQDDGKIVLAGSADAAFLVARFDASGAPDTGFGGGDGVVTSDLGGLAEAKGIAIDSSTGAILLTGGAEPNGLGIVRYTASGAPDPSFGGGDGEVIDAFFAGYATGHGIAIQSDDKIVVSGGGNEGGTEGFAVARYTPAGSPDNTFAGNGKRVTNFFAGTNDVSTDVAVRPDGKIVAMGTADIPDTPVADCGGPGSIDYGLTRYNADGSLDNTFGANGKVTTDIGNTADNGYAAVVQPEGPILLAGRAGSDFSLARYEPDGEIDTTFSNDGRVTTDLSACDVARDVALSDDGLLVTGSTVDAQGSHFTLVRYLWQEHAANAATPPDGTVSTAGTLGSSNPVITEVTTPSGGAVEITEAAGSAGEAPTGYTLLNFLIAITAPTESSSDPLEVVFNLDDAQLPPGGVAAVDVYRNGVVLPDCTLAGEIPLGETACVKAREEVGDDGKVTVLTVEASDWEFTLRPALVDASVPAKMKVGPATRIGVPVTFENRYAQSTDTILLRRKGKTIGTSINADQPAGESTIEVKPRRSAGRKLRRLDKVRVQVKITAEAPGTDPASLTRSILLKG